tara:strand:+ start:1846 stop:2037 length:192 start_codon:yes stop_codon:yes gene_type:complete
VRARSSSNLPQPSGRESLKTPNKPSKEKSSPAITPDLRGNLNGDKFRPVSIKLVSYSKKACGY